MAVDWLVKEVKNSSPERVGNMICGEQTTVAAELVTEAASPQSLVIALGTVRWGARVR